MATVHRFTFPPFPSTPEGVNIIAFKDYVETGIKIQPEDYDGPEVDGLDIPTVPMSKVHKGDFCKTNSRSRNAALAVGGKGSQESVPTSQKTWVARWEDLARQRSGEHYDPSQDRTSRLHQATRAFNDRHWPKDIHIRNIWDQFLIYIEFLNIAPIFRPKQDLLENDGDGDDDDDTFDDQEMAVESTGTPDRPPVEVGSQEVAPELQLSQENHRNSFLDDPERAVKIYLSSYMHKQGLHYEERNLTLLPLLVRFYVDFLLHDRVFASEPEIEASLRQALSVIDVARIELPLTSQITKQLSSQGKFGEACEELFGIKSMEQELSRQAYRERMDKIVKADVSSTAAATRATTPTPDGSNDLDNTDEENLDMMETSASPVETSAPPPTPISTSWGSEEDTVLDTPTNESGGWGTQADDSGASGGWGQTKADDMANAWGNDDSNTWVIPEPATLIPLIGPMALQVPLTHTSGIVESSVRRIVSIAHPAVEPSVDGEAANTSAKAVEASLSGCLSKVVLEPWLGWDTSAERAETSIPLINGSSRGRVVVYEEGQGVAYDHNSNVHSNGFAAPCNDTKDLPPAHDPLKHSITLFSSRRIARVTDLDLRSEKERKESEIEIETQKENGNVDGTAGDPGKAQRFWYMSNVLLVLPSYHT
ncbi:hypothetical protein BT96DRAFT_926601 [Gymnopus androsaceus JB14]|uniref:Uncharacterized protein n=1 Tax=Gymnopus androsaceus JB14 TaxID=1447944 RepID=A0A6A4GUB3_9AGAR|nr:hypothetical protein BT96DRAFT_926601 [Gymnopus androsaceus JB14]